MADKEKIVRKQRICILGPSFVGKTQVVSRFVNNSFSPHHTPTLMKQVFRRAFNILEEADVDPQFIELELWDLFPHNHPLLEESEDYSEMAAYMSKELNKIMKNDDPNIFDTIHGFMFIFDASNKQSFYTAMTAVQTIKDIEKSARKGKNKGLTYLPKKILVGNKKDLKGKRQVVEKSDLKNCEGMRYREVSALTNHGITEAFKVLVTDIWSDPALIKFEDQERNKQNQGNKDKDGKQPEDSYYKDNFPKKMKQKQGGGFLSFLPAVCFGGRDEEEDEDEEEEQDHDDPASDEEGAEGFVGEKKDPN